MMSGVLLETCWAFNKLWNNKFYYKLHLAGISTESYCNGQIHEYQIYKCCILLFNYWQPEVGIRLAGTRSYIDCITETDIVVVAWAVLPPQKYPCLQNIIILNHIDACVPFWHEFKYSIVVDIGHWYLQPFMNSNFHFLNLGFVSQCIIILTYLLHGAKSFLRS
jgi:hypothetical protein